MRQEKERKSEAELVDRGGKLRLYVDAPLAPGVKITASNAQTHYLVHVMRARAGASVLLFNGRDGEWRAQIAELTKKDLTLICERMTEPQAETPDIWLAFAPIKKTPADYVAQKATELGVGALMPVITRRTVVRRVNMERMQANAVEAAEQSGRLSVPELREPVSLGLLLQGWPASRRLVFCDEAGDALPIADALTRAREPASPWGVLTGPEGGFDPDERKLIRSCSFVLPVTLGPRIVRADTAALAALAVWQALVGDWR